MRNIPHRLEQQKKPLQPCNQSSQRGDLGDSQQQCIPSNGNGHFQSHLGEDYRADGCYGAEHGHQYWSFFLHCPPIEAHACPIHDASLSIPKGAQTFITQICKIHHWIQILRVQAFRINAVINNTTNSSLHVHLNMCFVKGLRAGGCQIFNLIQTKKNWCLSRYYSKKPKKRNGIGKLNLLVEKTERCHGGSAQANRYQTCDFVGTPRA